MKAKVTVTIEDVGDDAVSMNFESNPPLKGMEATLDNCTSAAQFLGLQALIRVRQLIQSDRLIDCTVQSKQR